MITKGTVEKVLNKWYARVRIPIYDGIDGGEGATKDVNLSQATVCALPNTITNLEKGDVVYVAFEDDDIGKPVIIGWLQKGTGNTSEVGLTLSTLTTKSTTVLDKQTYIGNIAPREIQQLENIKDNIQGQIDLTNSNLNDLKETVDNITLDIDQDIQSINNDLTPIKQALAEYDISKGTVEERLTNLGFKEGSIALASGTASVNSVKRQGNYVIGELTLTNFSYSLQLPQSSTTIRTIRNIGNIPPLFRPKETITIPISARLEYTLSPQTVSAITVQASTRLFATIDPYGTIYLGADLSGSSNLSTKQLSILASSNYPMILNFGYEVDPITT